ncbi:MAG: LacI family DNA-binding transcriptional regulator [Armatimonadetes bacterium]|nr:LacI family DNA-binding transcriptional regulator [Armatimonadota bacterium]
MSSIREVAKHAGVSPATVSRAFASPDLINEQTKRRVLDSARTLEYRPPQNRSIAGAKVRQKRNEKNGSFLPDTMGFQFFAATDSPGDTIATNNFYAPVLSGAQAQASELGVNLLVSTTTRNRFLAEAPRMIRERAIEGMLLVGRADTEVLGKFAQNVSEIILVDYYDKDNGFEGIISDSFGGAYEITRYLVELGHRRIGFFLGGAMMGTFHLRENGYVCALFESGITPNRDLVIGATDNEEIATAELYTLLRSPDRPTAIVAANDTNAIAALKMCRELRLRVPEDISIAGFDDVESASHTDPPLTTVRVNKESMGRYAVRSLWDRLKRRELASGSEAETSPMCHLLPVLPVIRQSCCPPKS